MPQIIRKPSLVDVRVELIKRHRTTTKGLPPMNWTEIWIAYGACSKCPRLAILRGLGSVAFSRKVNPDLAQCGELMEAHQQGNLSTSRGDYFRDLFMGLDERRPLRVVTAILDEIPGCDENAAAEIRAVLADGAAGASATFCWLSR